MKRNIIITIISVLLLTCIIAFARTTTTDLGLVKPTWTENVDILDDINANSDLIEAFANDPLEFDTGERLEDRAGAMFSSNTETGLTVTYQDSDNTIDVVIGASDIVESMLKFVDSPDDEDFFTYESSTGDFEWHSIADVSASIAADFAEGELADSIIVEDDLKVVDSPADEDFFTYEVTTGDFEWHSIADISAGIAADIAEGELADSIVVEDDLKFVNSPNDEEIFTYEATTGDFEWHTLAELSIAGLGSNTDITSLDGLTGSIATPTNISMTGELDMTGANVVIDLNPDGVGTVQVINITPSHVLETDEAVWDGILIDGNTLQPTGDDISVYGIRMDFSGFSPTEGSVGDHVDGLKITMPDIKEHAIHVVDGKIRITGEIPSIDIARFTTIDISYDVDAMVGTSAMHAIDVAIDEGEPAGDVTALGTHTYVNVIHQHIGTFAGVDQTGDDSFAGIDDDGVYTAGLNTVEIFEANGDGFWIGAVAMFDELEVDMSTDATKDVVPTFWYWKDKDPTDGWEPFDPADDTEGFQHSGLIRFNSEDLTDWLIYDLAGALGAEGYWIKVTRTATADPGTPTALTIKTGAVTLYAWDKVGDLNVKDIDANDIDAASLVLDTQLAIAEGGTNSSTALNNSKVMVSSGDAIIESATITTTELELLNGLGNTIVTDNNAVTELEGTGLAITTGTLNMTVPTEHIDSDMYVDGSIDNEHLSPDIISGLADVTSEDADYILIWDNTDSALKKVDMGEVRGAGGGATTFVELTDTPANFTSAANKFLQVNDTPDALIFDTIAEADISDLGTTIAMVADKLDVFSATTSAELAGVISDEIGTGKLRFDTSVTTFSSVDTVTVAQAGLILVSAGSDYTLTLPTASGNIGLTYKFVKTDYNYNLITLDGNSTETLNYENSTGSPNQTYLRLNTPLAEVTVVSDGSNWQVINEALGQVPEASVYLSGDKTELTDDTWTTLPFDTEEYDIGSNFNTGTYRFTCPVAGKYLIIPSVEWKGGSLVVYKRYGSIININNTASYNMLNYIHSSVDSSFHNNPNKIISFSKDDYFELQALHTAGIDTVDITGGNVYETNMFIKLVSKD